MKIFSAIKTFKIAANIGLIALAVYVVHVSTGLSRSYSNDIDLRAAAAGVKGIKSPYDASVALDQAYRHIYLGTKGPYLHCTVCYSEETYTAEEAQSLIDDLMIEAIAQGDERAIKAVFRVDPDPRIIVRALRDRSTGVIQEAASLSGSPEAVRVLASEIGKKGENRDVFYNPASQG